MTLTLCGREHIRVFPTQQALKQFQRGSGEWNGFPARLTVRQMKARVFKINIALPKPQEFALSGASENQGANG